MCLFDVIRYPISNPPTVAELDALPVDLFNKWCKHLQWFEPVNKISMVHHYTITPGHWRDLDCLREMIRDYDEHV